MKTTKILSLLILFATCIATSAQERPHRKGSRRFEPGLNGTWQMCSFSPGQDGQPQLSLLPVLKIVSSDNEFQNIAIPSEGACFVQRQGTIEKTSDSTYVEHLLMMMPDSTAAEPQIYRYRTEGPMWLIIEYNEPGKTEASSELWMRVHPKRQANHEPGKAGRPHAGGPNGRASRKSKDVNIDNYNPFKDESSDDSDSE